MIHASAEMVGGVAGVLIGCVQGRRRWRRLREPGEWVPLFEIVKETGPLVFFVAMGVFFVGAGIADWS